jgi:flagellar hook-length control protein FliK
MVFIQHEYESMSATPLPLPAVQTVTAQASAPSPQRNNQREGDTAFDTHLHDARRQQQSSNDEASSAKAANTARNARDDQSSQASDSDAQAANKPAPSTQTSTPAPAGTSSSSSTTESDNDSGTPSVTSLASSVLSLLEQATGDAEGSSTAAAGSKPAAGKSTAQPNNNPLAHVSPQAVAIAPAPIPQVAAATKGSANTNNTVQASGAAASNAGGATSLTALQNTVGTAKDDTDDDDAGDADTASTSGIGSAAAQTVTDSAQALSATAMTAAHAISAATTAVSVTPSQTQSTPDFASLRGALDATAIAAQPAADTSTAHSLSNNAPVGSSGFAKELGQQVTWLSGQEVKQAQIRLNPENLGPLDVKVSVEHGRVDVAFMTQHPEATAAVQQGLDQLNQMLSGQGLSLGHTSVGQHAQQQQFDGSSQQGSSSQTSDSTADAIEDTATSVLQRVAVGLVDAFA